MTIRLLLGDCIERMHDFAEDSIGFIVCDPPYDLTSVSRGGSSRVAGTGPFGRHTLGTKTSARGFMGKEWDGTGIAFSEDFWDEVFRILKPGGMVKAFSGTRTFHRMAMAMAHAGFEELRLETWAYGSGFPKSLNVAKAIDAALGAERGTKQVPFTGNALMRSGGQNTRPWMEDALSKGYHEMPDDEPVSDEAKLWLGWGTALKPAWEPILVGRKPSLAA